MALLNKNQIDSTKNMIQTLTRLDTAVSGIVDTKNAYINEVQKSYELLRDIQAMKILENMDIEQINVDKDGIRVAALKNAGIQNIYQVLQLSHEQLCGINGIGDAGASKIEKNAGMLKLSVGRMAQVKLTAEKPDRQMTALIKALYDLIRNDAAFTRAEQLYSTYHEPVRKNISSVQIMTGSLKWMFSSGKKKEKAADASNQLNQILQGEFGVEALAVIEEHGKNNLHKTQTAKQNKVRIIGAVPVENQMDEDIWLKDFARNAAPYYAMLEKVMGEETGHNVNAGIGSLPEELLQSIENYELDLSLLKANLRRYQTFGTKYILHQERVLLGDEMGLGKTMQAIAAFCHLAGSGHRHFLVVCPLSVVVNWRREIEAQSELSTIEVYGEGRDAEMAQWATDGGVAITTYETLNKVPIPEKLTVDMMVVDEAHYIKNPEAQRTKSVLAAVEKSNRILFMSGTPLENRIEEMYFLISCLQPEIAGQIKDMKQLADADRFREAVAPVYLRRVREDVLKELPELVEKEQWGLMNPDETAIYKDALLEGNFMAVRQVSWQVSDISKSTKAQRLLEICECAREENRKLIIFSFFRSVLVKVSAMLGEYCIGVIDGSVPASHRQKMIDELKEAKSGSALVCQIQAGGVGLNIQAANVVIFCEPQIKPSLETQAVARAYRMGQSQSVIVHRLLMQDTVDERIMDILHQKSELFNHFADESVIGEMDTQMNEKKVMSSIVEEEMKRLGLEGECKQ